MTELTYRDLPGRAFMNPLGEPPWILNVTAVSEPEPDGLITITALEGTVTCCADLSWSALEYTPEVRDLIATLALDARFEGDPA